MIRATREFGLTVPIAASYIGSMRPDTRRNRNNPLSIDHAVT
jgi:hypothetical protein